MLAKSKYVYGKEPQKKEERRKKKEERRRKEKNCFRILYLLLNKADIPFLGFSLLFTIIRSKTGYFT